jgi:hypothetical protein
MNIRPMMITIRWMVALAAVAFLSMARPATAQTLGEADRAAFRQVISDQLAALRRDDGGAAFALAAPGIRETFGTPDAFMEMVRAGYQPVYRPQVFEFGIASVGPHGPEQRVFVVGPDGRDYVAIYPMERQPDGRWLVNGCLLTRPEGA